MVQSKTTTGSGDSRNKQEEKDKRRIPKRFGIFISFGMLILTMLISFQIQSDRKSLMITFQVEGEKKRNNKTLSLSLKSPKNNIHQPPIPASFIYVKELYDDPNRLDEQNENNITTNNNRTIVMNPNVYTKLTNRIRRIKHENKPLLISINSIPCAGKSWFLHENNNNFMGCNLLDFDYLPENMDSNGKRKKKNNLSVARDSSYLLRPNVTNNTALLGGAWESHNVGDWKKYNDVVYLYVIPPLKTIERNLRQRQKEVGEGRKWATNDPVLERRRLSLRLAIRRNDNVLVEPLFATFQEGLQFCINTYNAASV